MNPRIAACAAALGASLLVPHAAIAGDRGGNKDTTTIALSRPSDGTDADAEGKVRVERGRKGEQTVLQLSRLDPRTVYEVRDAATGETLGEVKTNRRGRANFNLTKRLAKRAAAEGFGEDGVEDVEIVDPETGECVLEGGVVADPCEGLQFGWADYRNDAGDSASIFMESAPGFDSESFSLTFFPIQESFAAAYFDFHRDTLLGDTLPLGVDSVIELAGRGFQIVAPDGTVLLDDVLPDLEEEECIAIDDPVEGEWPGEFDWDGDFDWNGEFDWSGGYDWSGGHDGSGDWTDPSADDSENTVRHGRMKKARQGGVRDIPETEDPIEGYTLRIEDENGDFADAGVLEQILYDQPVDCPWTLPGDGDFGGIFIGIIIVPLDGSFDLEALLDRLFGGGEHESSDENDYSDFFGNGSKHRTR